MKIWVVKVLTEAADEYLWAFDANPSESRVASCLQKDLTPEEFDYISSINTIELDVEEIR